MDSIVKEPLDDVLSKYDIRYTKIRNESYKNKKGVWWVQTDKGIKVLKKISNSEETFRFILSAVNHLTSNGINIPRVNKTKDDNDYVNIDGTCFVLLDAAEGKNPSYSSPAEFEAIVKELAKFHVASEGFKPVQGTKPKIHLGRWIDDYESQISDMNDFYTKELLKNNDSEIAQLIIREFPYFHERALKIIEALKGKEYKDWVSAAAIKGGLCHQDFAAGNLIINPSGKIYVLDTDSITIDIPARDIRKLLNKIMKKNGKWDSELAKKFINYYQSINALNKDQWKVVMLDLTFPHLFIGAMNKFYYQRDKEWNTEKYLERIKEMSAFEKTRPDALDNLASFIPV